MIRDDFFKLFNELPSYYRKVEDELYSRFELKTIMNRYYQLTPKYYSKKERGEYLRSGTNATVQSPANDIVLCGIIEVVETLPNDQFRICATVHDSIIAEVRKDSLHLVKQAQAIMEHPKLVKEFLVKDFELDVELKVDIEIGPWGMGIPYDQYIKENKL
jgi:DNA polymerase I-like protein with 3'-5' exonuclease and polymerase domains